MYIALSWMPIGESDVDEIEGEILAAIAAFKFVNFFPPYEGMFLANIRKKESMFEVQRLHSALLDTCTGRFSYVIAIAPNFQTLPISPDLPTDACKRIVDYET
jgi:hypothetical protein